MLPLAPQFSALLNGAGAHVAEPSSDVVLQARQQWAESCGQCLHDTRREKPTVNPIKLGQPLGGLGEGRTRRVQREEPEIDPVSGLEVWQTQSLTIELIELCNLNDVVVFFFFRQFSAFHGICPRFEMPSLSPPRLEGDFGDFSRAPEPAELLGPAPELREEFGTQAEHFQVPRLLSKFADVSR